MSSTVSLMGITALPIPCLAEWYEEIGHNSLRDTLSWEARESSCLARTHILEHEQDFTRYRVLDPFQFADELEASPEYWDSLQEREKIITALRTHPEYTWWFHIH